MSLDPRQCIYCNLPGSNATPVQKARKHTDLTKHMDDSHPECDPIDGVLCCPQCNRHFVRDKTLEEHIKRMHKRVNPLDTLANAATREYERMQAIQDDERRDHERRVQENERLVYDQAKRARAIHQYRKNINRSPLRQDRRGLIPHTIFESDYEFKAKRSGKAKKSIKRSGKTKKSVKRSGKAKKSVKRSGKAKRV